MTTEEVTDERFVISRQRTEDLDRKNPDDRVFVIQTGLRTFRVADEPEGASHFLADQAQTLLDRGRWIDLDPRIEPAPQGD